MTAWTCVIRSVDLTKVVDISDSYKIHQIRKFTKENEILPRKEDKFSHNVS